MAKYAPLGASVWRSLTRNPGWNGHLPPFQLVSAPHSKWGEREAPRVVLRRLRECYLTTHGQGTDACPIEGLFPPVSSRYAAGGPSVLTCSCGASPPPPSLGPATSQNRANLETHLFMNNLQAAVQFF